MTLSRPSLLLFAGLCSACAGELDPCAEGYAAYSDDGERFDDLEDAPGDAEGRSMVLHICRGTHTFPGGTPLELSDARDGHAAEYTIVGAGQTATVLDGDWGLSLLQLYDSKVTVSDLTILRGRVEVETFDDGGESAASVGGGAHIVSSDVLFARVTFRDNMADDGAAFSVYGGSNVSVRDSLVVGNAGGHGGAVSLRGSGATLVSEGTSWAENTRADVAFIANDGDREGTFDDDGGGSFTCEWDTRSCE